MASSTKRSIKNTEIRALGLSLIVVSVLGIILIATQTIAVPEFTSNAITATVAPGQPQTVPLEAADEEFTKLVLESPTIIPSSIKVASLEPAYKLKVVLYEFEVSDLAHRSGYRIYDNLGKIKYEDNSSLWLAAPTYWRTIRLGDFDQDGSRDIFIGGTVDGTGAYQHNIVLTPGRGGFTVLNDEVLN